jgi:hypothetical protein
VAVHVQVVAVEVACAHAANAVEVAAYVLHANVVAAEVAGALHANVAVHAPRANAVVVDALAHVNAVAEVAYALPARMKDGAQMVAMVVQK